MNDVRWSDSQLRDYIAREFDYDNGSDDSSLRAARDRFCREVVARLVPGIQSKVLGRIGTVTDPQGIVLIARELMIDIHRQQARRR